MYLKGEIRERLNNWEAPMNSADLAFCISNLVKAYYQERIPGDDLHNSIIGALGNVKTEFFNSVVKPYNRQKQFENGEIFTTEKKQKKTDNGDPF
jgi:hypothetical protein